MSLRRISCVAMVNLGYGGVLVLTKLSCSSCGVSASSVLDHPILPQINIESSPLNFQADTGEFSLLNYGPQHETNRVAQDRYPYAASLFFEDWEGAWYCGGTLVAQDILLTAAHCMPSHEEDFFGEAEVGGDINRDTSRIVEYRSHDGFHLNGYPDFDVALVRIDSCTDGTPIRLGGEENITGPKAWVALISNEAEVEGDPDQNRSFVEYETRLDNECEPWRSRTDLGTLTERMMCTSEKHEDDEVPKRHGPGIGDSGGPLLLKGQTADDDIQVGIISFGYNGEDEPKVPSVHSRISPLNDWITSTVASMSRCL